MQEIKSVQEADVAGKRVVLRVDFNVPLEHSSGYTAIVDDFRIRATLPTLELLHTNGAAKIIILTHIGRPEGKVVDELRVAPVAEQLRTLTQVPFEMRENLRFDPREEANDPEFAKELASLGDVYVNEAFPVSHRADASIVGVSKLIPGYAGLQFMQEHIRISAALTPPPGSVAIVGGAKFETKRPLIDKLLQTYDEVLLGGALGNDVIKARGWPVGASLISAPVPVDIASNERLFVAKDAVLKNVDAGAERTALVVDTQAHEMIVDIGPTTAILWADKIERAPFVLWNGPLGVYEQGFTFGTDGIAQAIVQGGTNALIGGGDTAAAIRKFTFDKDKVFVSTAGGAMLEFLTAGTLPGIEALKN